MSASVSASVSASASTAAPLPPSPLQLPEALLARAGALLQSYLSAPDGAKCAAKLAAALPLARRHVGGGDGGWARLQARVRELLEDRQTSAAAVRLIMAIGGLDAAVDRADALALLVADGQEAVAERWAAALGRADRAAFVAACVGLGRLKVAAQAVRAFDLRDEFPTVEVRAGFVRLMHARLLRCGGNSFASGGRVSCLCCLSFRRPLSHSVSLPPLRSLSNTQHKRHTKTTTRPTTARTRCAASWTAASGRSR